MEFREQLDREMKKHGVSRNRLALRMDTNYQQIGRWLRGDNVPSAEDQRAILAACRLGDPTVALLISEFEEEMVKRLGALAGDIETLLAAAKATPAGAVSVVPSQSAKRRAK